MDRRECLTALTGGALAAGALAAEPTAAANQAQRATIVNGAEHAWVINDRRFPMNPRLSNCPNSTPDRDYSMEHLLAQLQVHGIDKVVISHVCYYGSDNSYTIHCVKTHSDRLAAGKNRKN